METKKCSRCKQVFPKTSEFFGWKSKEKQVFNTYCVECNREYFKEYRQKNKKKITERQRQWSKESKERQSEIHRQYRERNREKILKRQRKRNAQPEIRKHRSEKHRYRYLTDPVYKMRHLVSNAVYDRLKGRTKNRNRALWQALSYTPEQLKEHLEKQFEPWMSWDNHGEWHIDHICPQSKLPYDSFEHPNFQKCWALENLRPLEAAENIRKGNKELWGE